MITLILEPIISDLSWPGGWIRVIDFAVAAEYEGMMTAPDQSLYLAMVFNQYPRTA